MTNKVTVNSIADRIDNVRYYILPDTTVTICMIRMKNGYSVIGKSACVDPTNFNQALGEKYAYEDAFEQVWPLEGYLLSEKLSGA